MWKMCSLILNINLQMLVVKGCNLSLIFKKLANEDNSVEETILFNPNVFGICFSLEALEICINDLGLSKH